MYFLYGVFAAALAIMLVLGVIEQRRHFRNLDRIPVRVLVNGIRGKSSITRLTAGALPRKWRGRVVDLGGAGRTPREIWEQIAAYANPQASLIAIGNIHGNGEELLDLLASSRRVLR